MVKQKGGKTRMAWKKEMDRKWNWNTEGGWKTGESPSDGMGLRKCKWCGQGLLMDRASEGELNECTWCRMMKRELRRDLKAAERIIRWLWREEVENRKREERKKFELEKENS